MADKKVVFKRIGSPYHCAIKQQTCVRAGLNNPSILCNFPKTRFAIVSAGNVIGPCNIYFSTPFLIDRIVVEYR